jgi:hypothetical protein
MKYLGCLGVLVLTIILFFSAWDFVFTNKGAAAKALKAMSFHQIHLHGYKWFACAEDDWSHTAFSAINSSGDQVTGTVCCGLIFKNCTIRFN